jgi:hypothetical protein
MPMIAASTCTSSSSNLIVAIINHCAAALHGRPFVVRRSVSAGDSWAVPRQTRTSVGYRDSSAVPTHDATVPASLLHLRNQYRSGLQKRTPADRAGNTGPAKRILLPECEPASV